MSLDAISPSHWHPVDWSIVGPALVAGLLVLSTHVPLGQRVLRKGIVFIDLAIAQIAGLGVIAAGTLGWSDNAWAVQGAAVGTALLGAVLLTWMERRWPDIQEALIGALFVLASSVGILLLAGNPHGGEHLKDLLVGQILWVTPDQLWGVAALSASVLAVWFGAQRWLGQAGFYLLFAVAVTASVQLVGVYLVFSSLIMPALAVRQAPRRWQLPLAWGAGALAYTLGLCVSAMLDWPSGAVVVVAMALLCALTACVAPRVRLPNLPEGTPE
ncbi:MAG: metal ABC transporter permease [Aquabacterium sp.]|jgi:zinc/manganese transport system permease protein|uniref:metal ABC transporter permease n=1 Tax=Aquabacterium sp. TaxID=1872578 RepID=UPI002A370478|nr:metal ABC transporter permease [Aquabacterium sp.]MDX9845280.1 metal ABC transporter permease [Aquabacterium sp.]